MRMQRSHSIVFLSVLMLASGAAIVFAADPAAKKDIGKMRGPLDGHAVWVRQIVDALELSDAQRTEVNTIIDEGHAAWRKWFEANHEQVAAHTNAVRDAKESGDKALTKEAMKKKKAFMHTAPSIFRHPEPVRRALPESLRATFDARLQEQIKKVHTRKPTETIADGDGAR
jgi:Spy/CpxP family protein refolding chaperone